MPCNAPRRSGRGCRRTAAAFASWMLSWLRSAGRGARARTHLVLAHVLCLRFNWATACHSLVLTESSSCLDHHWVPNGTFATCWWFRLWTLPKNAVDTFIYSLDGQLQCLAAQPLHALLRARGQHQRRPASPRTPPSAQPRPARGTRRDGAAAARRARLQRPQPLLADAAPHAQLPPASHHRRHPAPPAVVDGVYCGQQLGPAPAVADGANDDGSGVPSNDPGHCSVDAPCPAANIPHQHTLRSCERQTAG